MLLLRRADDGAMDLCAYDLSSHAVTDEHFPPLPIAASTADFSSVADLIGGIAYHSSSDMLVLVAEDGVWQSLKREEFVHTVPTMDCGQNCTPP